MNLNIQIFYFIILGTKLTANGIYEKLQQKQLVDFIWYNLQKEKDILNDFGSWRANKREARRRR